MVNEHVVEVPHLTTPSNAVIRSGHVENILTDRHQTLGRLGGALPRGGAIKRRSTLEKFVACASEPPVRVAQPWPPKRAIRPSGTVQHRHPYHRSECTMTRFSMS